MNAGDANTLHDTPGCWRRRRPRSPLHITQLLRLVFLIAAGCGVAAGCGAASVSVMDSPDATPTESVPASQPPEPTATTTPSLVAQGAEGADRAEPALSDLDPTPLVEPTATPHPIALADTELPPATIGFDDLLVGPRAGPQPISIEIDTIDVSSATVIPVGVDDDLAFEVPPADQVGWYEFGSVPGQEGSAVLAAHIAYNGVDGVFRYLEDVDIGAVVVIGFDDGSRQRYRIEEITEYVKEDLPDSLFARSGDPQLALITCGGNFNEQLDSYESNTVAIAVPI